MTGALQQSDHFTNTLQSLGVKAFFDDDSQSHYVQRGPLIYLARAAQSAPLRAARGINRRAVTVINPDTANAADLRAAGFRQLMTPASVGEIDLTQPLSPLPNWRASLSEGRTSALTVTARPLVINDDAWFFAADTAQQKAKRFRAMPHAIAQFWPAEHTLFVQASLRSEPVAAMLFLVHGTAATYQIAWTNAQGRANCAHHLLLHHAATTLCARGVARLDLGTIDTVNAAGLARFKIGAGAQVRQLGGTWGALPRIRR